MTNPYLVLPCPVRVLVVAPSWKVGDKDVDARSIIRMPLPPIADDAVLFLWRDSSMPKEALDVIDAWGYRVKSEVLWVRPSGDSQGTEFRRDNHEICHVATRGRFKPSNKAVKSIYDTIEFVEPDPLSGGLPSIFYSIVERLCFGENNFTLDEGPVELFGRTPRPGWHVFGNEVGPEKKTYVGTPAVVRSFPAGSIVVGPETKTMGAGPMPPDPSVGAPQKLEEVAQNIAISGGNVQVGDKNEQTISLPDSVATELGEHPALVDDDTMERAIARAVSTGLVKRDELPLRTESAWKMVLQRAVEKGISIATLSGDNTGEMTVAVAPPAPEPVVENLSELTSQLCTWFRSPTSFSVVDVAKWPRESRDHARRWIAGKSGPPPEVLAYMEKAQADQQAAQGHPVHHHAGKVAEAAPIAEEVVVVPPENGGAIAGPPKKLGRPKKAKPCPGCGTPTPEKMCEICAAMLAGRQASGITPAVAQKMFDETQAANPHAPPQGEMTPIPVTTGDAGHQVTCPPAYDPFAPPAPPEGGKPPPRQETKWERAERVCLSIKEEAAVAE